MPYFVFEAEVCQRIVNRTWRLLRQFPPRFLGRGHLKFLLYDSESSSATVYCCCGDPSSWEIVRTWREARSSLGVVYSASLVFSSALAQKLV